MCQQWLSVIGQFLDVFGFLLITWEWWKSYIHSRDKRMSELQDDSDRFHAETQGESYYDHNPSMAHLFSRLFMKDWVFRGRLFTLGVILVLLGFGFQALGSWPGGVPLVGFKSC